MTDHIRVVHERDLQDAVDTPGLRRRAAFESDDHWFGHVEAAPNTMSGWHHHGDTLTIGYVLRGALRLEYGLDGQQAVSMEAGDYFTVPPQLVHREGNATEVPSEVILVRIGEGPPVFPVDGPEPS